MKIQLFALTTLLALGSQAETFTIDTGHAEIGFAVKHMMVSNTKGTFNTFEGTVDFDTESKELQAIQGSIDTASIDTNNESRDEHLRNADFFNVVKFPKMTFQSTAVKSTGENTYEVTGTLNVLGIDRTVVLPITINGPIDDQRGFKRIGIESQTELNRRELGITHSPAAMIGDEVKIDLQFEATFK
ncbi:YceI family protein [Pontiellaceae bacterium B12219]|nr:YceI family protein [Pontiellaceae bacterium B12219]